MAVDESNAVRNGVIATVIGGLLLAALAELWPPFKVFLSWLWEQASWLGSFFTGSYSIKGWVLFGLVLLGLPSIIHFFMGLKKHDLPAFTRYVEDLFYGAKWHWSWIENEISNLWCLCPQCYSELVYDDSSCRSIYAHEPSKTDFICEHCDGRTVASIPGGNKSYALSVVQREIRRRVRTNEYQTLHEQKS